MGVALFSGRSESEACRLLSRSEGGLDSLVPRMLIRFLACSCQARVGIFIVRTLLTLRL